MKKRKTAICLALAALTLVPYASGFGVSAGIAGVQIENGSLFEGTEDEAYADWNFSRKSGISLKKQGEKTVLNFGKDSDVGNPFISRTSVVLSKETEDGLTVEFTLSVSEMEGDKKFGLAYGLPRLDKDVGESGSSYVYFTKSGGEYKYAAAYYGKSEQTMIPETGLPAGADVGNLQVKIVVTANGKLKLWINGAKIYESLRESETNGNGFIGFAQSGAYTDGNNFLDASVSDLTILNEYYASPENPGVTIADFSNNEFNVKEWYLHSTRCAGSGLIVGEEKLKFDGSGQNTYFATRAKYSNFELELDMSDVRNYAVKDAQGQITSASLWFGLEFGRDGESAEACYELGNLKDSCFFYMEAGVNAVTGERSSTTSAILVDHGSYKQSVSVPEKYAMFNAEFQGTVRLKFAVKDGKFAFFMRLLSESEWTKVYEYEFAGGYTPTGYVGLRGEGNQYVASRTMKSASFYDIDNIVLTNYDAVPNVVKTGFESNVLPVWTDYKYVDTWTDDYLISHTKGRGTK